VTLTVDRAQVAELEALLTKGEANVLFEVLMQERAGIINKML
jgi:hypothetical protein